VLDAVGVGQGDRLEACKIHAPRLAERTGSSQKWNTSGDGSNDGPALAPANVAVGVIGFPWV
jgi:high-affinity K+ transport system ATPase subunit B